MPAEGTPLSAGRPHAERMDRKTTRRGLLGGAVGAGLLGAFSPAVRPFLDALAPLSGRVWGGFTRSVSGTVASPYGEATLRYDDDGVAHVSADGERALYYAVGFAHAADRLFQMDLQRRQLRGELSAAFGERTVDSDVFYTKLDMVGAAETTWAAVEGDDHAGLFEAYADGVNRYVREEPLPVEFRLLGFEPDEWSPVDSILAQKQIAWALTGRFHTLRRESVAAALSPEIARTLYPQRMDHDTPILRDDDGEAAPKHDDRLGEADLDPALADRVSRFEAPEGLGTNAWVVGGEHTESGAPALANDPHLALRVPPVWYEQHLETDELSVRGVTFPGTPPVVIGENDAGAWGFTNAGVDCIDFYRYDTRDDGREYRYGDEWRAFDRERRTVAVSGGEDREVVVEKTVHGPVIDAESDGDDLQSRVAVAWTGLTATETSRAVVELNRSDGLADVTAAMDRFDEPTQNFVYVDDETTYFRTVGRIPRRYADGEVVPGRRVFDGSEREGEWRGFTPYGESSWEGFVPLDDLPEREGVDYLATANQRIVDDPGRYLAEGYAPPFRGERIYELLDERAAADEPMTAEFLASIQQDVLDTRARRFVPDLLAAVGDPDDDALAAAVDALESWDHRMVPDSRGALLFDRALGRFRDRALEDALADGLGDRRDLEDYYPNDYVLLGLRGEPWFPDGRDAALRAALEDALAEIDDEGWETYGDLNRLDLDHPFDMRWLNYPERSVAGSDATVNNYSRPSEGGGVWGSSWRMLCPRGGDSRAILPGGNDGDPIGDNYHDQLDAWADGEYKSLARETGGDVAVSFEEDP
jgi:penicillin amidase